MAERDPTSWIERMAGAAEEVRLALPRCRFDYGTVSGWDPVPPPPLTPPDPDGVEARLCRATGWRVAAVPHFVGDRLQWFPAAAWVALPPPGSAAHRARRFASRRAALRWVLLRRTQGAAAGWPRPPSRAPGDVPER
jgi:hypothetical protein